MISFATDNTVKLIADFLWKSNGEYGSKHLARKDAEELIRYLIQNGVCLVERE